MTLSCDAVCVNDFYDIHPWPPSTSGPARTQTVAASSFHEMNGDTSGRRTASRVLFKQVTRNLCVVTFTFTLHGYMSHDKQ